jgi:TnsA endonuclease N terminal
MGKFAQGKFTMKNQHKYVGLSEPKYRSSWEFMFMKACDEHSHIHHWASESIKIPYRCPVTNRSTVYVPDFFIVYVDKDSKKHAELIEIKPSNHQLIEKVGSNPVNQLQYIKNQAKWEAAHAWAKQKGIKFRVINETDLFHTGKKRK